MTKYIVIENPMLQLFEAQLDSLKNVLIINSNDFKLLIQLNMDWLM